MGERYPCKVDVESSNLSDSTRNRNDMTEIDKKIIELKKDGFSNFEISQMLNLPINFVKKRGTKRFFEIQKRIEAKRIADKEFEKKVIEILPFSNSINHLCENLGVRGTKGYYDKIRKIITNNQLSTEHFEMLALKSKTNGRNKYTAMTNEEFFINGVKRNASSIIQRLIKGGFKNYQCENTCCGITTWQGKPLSLQIHHINGNHSDNRLENLQLLCPNCHSQTENFGKHNETYSFKITKRAKEINNNEQKTFVFPDVNVLKENLTPKTKKYCQNCGKEIQKNNKFCSQECSQKYRRKLNVSDAELINSFKFLKSFRKVGERYGVTDNAIKKRCIQNNIVDEVYKYITPRKRRSDKK